MYYIIFFVLQIIGIYIGIIFLSYYLIRRFCPSDDDVVFDKLSAIFWPFTIVLLILYFLSTFCVIFPIKCFNKILDNINKLANKEELTHEELAQEEVKNKDDIFLKKFHLMKNKNHTGVYAHCGDIVCTKTGLDLGIIAQASYDGIPLKIMSIYSPYNDDTEYHCGYYGGIDSVEWYSTGLSLPLSEWARITKEQYEKLNSNIGVYKYFSRLLNYHLGGVSYD